MIPEYFKIGYIARTHGLKGEVTIVASPDAPDWHSVKTVFIEVNQHFIPHFIHSCAAVGGKLLVKFEDIDSIEKATSLKGSGIYLLRSDRPKLRRGEFYDDEVIGFEVEDQRGTLGTIREVVMSGANRLLVLDHRGKEIYIPVNGPFIKNIHKAKRKVTVELPDGFLEI